MGTGASTASLAPTVKAPKLAAAGSPTRSSQSDIGAATVIPISELGSKLRAFQHSSNGEILMLVGHSIHEVVDVVSEWDELTISPVQIMYLQRIRISTEISQSNDFNQTESTSNSIASKNNNICVNHNSNNSYIVGKPIIADANTAIKASSRLMDDNAKGGDTRGAKQMWKEDSDIASSINILESSIDSFQMNAQPKHPSSYASAKRNSSASSSTISSLTSYSSSSSEASQYKAGEVKDTPIARTTFLYPPLYSTTTASDPADIDEALLDCFDK